MNQLMWFAGLVAIGYVLKCFLQMRATSVYQTVQKATWFLLLALILLQFWLNGFVFGNLSLIALGVALTVLPAVWMMWLPKGAKLKPYLLAYSTYGGGNRGVLAISLLAPTLLSDFLIMDLGIFLSLIVLFPMVVQRFEHIKANGFLAHLSKMKSVLLPIFLIILGSVLHRQAWLMPVPEILFPWVKTLLFVLVSVSLGLSLSFDSDSLRQDAPRVLIARVLGMWLPLTALCYVLLPSAQFERFAPLIGIAALLPVSSFAPQFVHSDELKAWLSNQVVLSSMLFVVLMVVAMCVV